MSAILTVDDSASIRQTVKIALSREGYAVGEAHDGPEGLKKADEERYDLFLIDLNMPGMDGIEMIRELRKNPANAGVPILFLSTESDAAVKRKAQDAGATGWLTKPFNADQLVRIVGKVLAK
jgi:two-component system, chemotaxis family, chemotaxis protein CheY